MDAENLDVLDPVMTVNVGIFQNGGMSEDGGSTSSTKSDVGQLLCEAIEGGRVEEVEELLTQGADVNKAYNELTPLARACALTPVGNLKIVKKLLDFGADVHIPDPDGKTAVHHLCGSGNRNSDLMDILELLLERGADVDAKDHIGRTGLFYACEVDDVKAVQHLIQAGCDVNIQTVCGESALKVACRNAEFWFYWHGRDLESSRHPDPRFFPPVQITKLLLQGGVDPKEATFLPAAVQFGYSSLVLELLALGMDVNLLDDSKRTPLGCACSSNVAKYSVVQMLLNHGADVNKAGGWKKQKPIILAYVHNSVEKIRLLLSYGAFVTSEEFTELVSLSLSKSILENPEVVGPWSRELMAWRLLIAAGFHPLTDHGLLAYKIQQLSICSSYKHISPWIDTLLFPLRTLKDCCRIAVRRQLDPSIDDKIPQLPLPNSLKDFLVFKEFSVDIK